jgi:endonuclease/exonuclease/phosphatase (EEP) superfamily protein YafD
MTYRFFDMRNNQFNILKSDFIGHTKDISPEDKIIMLGDFNVSPRSKYYKNLEDSIIGLKNITKNFTILFTWRIKNLPFVTSHIDHIFVSENSFVDNVVKLNTPNSDHR